MKIIDKSEDGWWLAELDGVVGHFPSMLVEDLDEDEYEQEIEGNITVTPISLMIFFCLTKNLSFVESGSLSEESLHDASPSGAPPPSFAPPKPAYLTPHSVVIIQPTPEVESRGTFGSEAEENVDGKQEPGENSDIPPACPPPPPPPISVVVDPEFSLDSPKKREEPVESKRKFSIQRSHFFLIIYLFIYLDKELDDLENLEETEDTTDFASLPPPIDDEEVAEDKSAEPKKEKDNSKPIEDDRGQESEDDFK